MKKIIDCSHFGMWHILDNANNFRDLIAKAYLCIINSPLTNDFYYERFNFQETHIDVPIDVYFKLCFFLAEELTDLADRTYYYSKAKAIYEKKQFSIFQSKFLDEYEIAKKWYRRNCRPKYKTIYGNDLAYLMHLNLSKKMSSLSKDIIERRNKSISAGMRRSHSTK